MTVGLDSLAEMAALAYVLVLVLAALDVILPVLPSESVVILGAVLVSQGRLSVFPLLVAASVGAILGDHLSYVLGRSTRGVGRRRPSGKVERVRAWARHQLAHRGPAILLIARFVPGGRTASTLMAGQVGFPLRTFTPLIMLAGVMWASLGVALGLIGGATFHDDTLLATGLGIVLGTGMAMGVELVLGRRARRNAAKAGRSESQSEQTLA